MSAVQDEGDRFDRASRRGGVASVVIWFGPFCILAGCVSLATAVSTTHWLEYRAVDGALLVHGGLFEGCLSQHNDTCRPWDNTPFDTFYLKAAIAVFIVVDLGHMLNFFIVSRFIWTATSRIKGSLSYVFFWFLVLGSNIAGICFFREFHTQDYTMENLEFFTILSAMDYGHSFHLSWGAIVLVVLGAALSWSIASHYVENERPRLFERIQGEYASKEVLQPVVSDEYSIRTSGAQKDEHVVRVQ